MNKTPKLDPIDDGAVLMTWDEFVAACRINAFIDYDGFGEFATADGSSPNHVVSPSQIETAKKPEWATHVAWFNK